MTEKPGLPVPLLPGGTVTFLFTDIEGSTQLLNRLRDQHIALSADHHKIIREALDKWHGWEVDTQGDAFIAAFPKATEAEAAVAQIQMAGGYEVGTRTEDFEGTQLDDPAAYVRRINRFLVDTGETHE